MGTNNYIRSIIMFFLCLEILNAQNAEDCFVSIEQFGAKLDGKTNDALAIQKSLEELNYAYIPITKEGVRIDETIRLQGNQKIFGLTRGSLLLSYVKPLDYAILVENVKFGDNASIENIKIDIFTKGSGGIKIFESRNVILSNLSISGNKIASTGITIDGGNDSGSAWNQINTYTIYNCKIGIELTSSTSKNWCNRNNIDFGVVQSCETGVKLNKANTNRILTNPQGCKTGFDLQNSHYNVIESFEENSELLSLVIDSKSRQNTFYGEYSIHKIQDLGKENQFILNKRKQELYDDLRRK